MEIGLQVFMLGLCFAGFALMEKIKAGLLVCGILGMIIVIGYNIDALVSMASK